METMIVIIDGKEKERAIDYYEVHPTRGFHEPVPYLYRGETYHRTVSGTVYIIKTE